MKQRTRLTILTLSLVTITLAAVDASATCWSISVLAGELSNSSGGLSDAGVALAATCSRSDGWDAELTVAARSYETAVTNVWGGISPGPPIAVTVLATQRVHPLDFTVARRFRRSSRISPYLRAGMRYVQFPDDVRIIAFPDSSTPFAQSALEKRFDAEVGMGVRLRLTTRTAVRADVMRLIRSDGVFFDPLTRGAVGVSWNF